MRPNPQFTTDLVTFAEEIRNGKLHFLCSDTHNSLKVNKKYFVSLSEDLEMVLRKLK